MKKKSEPYIPLYKVSGKAMNLIASIAAATTSSSINE